jgi:hypothetical protein
MRRVVSITVSLVFLAFTICSCTQPKGGQKLDDSGLFTSMNDKLSMESGESGGGEDGIEALARVFRVVVGDEGREVAEVYDIEYAGSELRTSAVHRDEKGSVSRSDAFFNVDGTLSFVRMRDAGGNTKTVHFVYDASGNPLERIVSVDDVPIEKVVYEYDRANEYRRGLKRFEWDGGRWREANGCTLALYVNSNDIPTAFENQSAEGKRAVVFELAQDGVTLDNYSDTLTMSDGSETTVTGFVGFRDGRPESMTVHSDAKPEEDLRIEAQWKEGPRESGERVVSETLRRCAVDDCREVERRKYVYEFIDTEPGMPPPSMVLPFLELGSSLVFIEKPDILLGKEGIGLPSWIDL